jgi:indole-3-glycerol phosphate synthase
MANILDTIVAQKQREITSLPVGPVSVEAIRAVLQARGETRDFAATLRTRATGHGVALIAEIKKASPSAGVIRPDFDPISIARSYQSAGAACLSVLTDEQFFQGSLQYLEQVRGVVKLPLLRKDFIIDDRQILQAARHGADAVLLIAAILSDAQLRGYRELAEDAGLSALVEVHDEEELDRAMATGATLIGVNNRNLKTFKVDLATTERLAERLWSRRERNSTLLVAESGIHTREDVSRLTRCGASAILVGESLMRHPDIEAKTRELLA